MSLDVVYTISSTATGGGRDGHVKSATGRIDLDTRPPKEMGGNGEGTNPEELFSAGYAACFLGAIRAVGRNEKVAVPDDTTVDVTVGFGKTESGFGINAAIKATLPGLAQADAEAPRRQGAPAVPVLERDARQHRRRPDHRGLIGA